MPELDGGEERNSKDMKFNVCRSRSTWRTGLLQLPLTEPSDQQKLRGYETPMCFQYTSGGVIPHLSWELSEKLDDLRSPLMVPLQTTFEMKDSLKMSTGGFRNLAAMDTSRPIFLASTDPLEHNKSGFNDKKGISIWPRGGRVQINADNFTDFVTVFKPDAYQSLCDSDTPEDASNKRITHSVSRSLEYLDNCISSHSYCVFGTVVGGYDLKARRVSAVRTSSKSVSGFVVDGFVRNNKLENSLSFQKAKELLVEVIQLLPPEKPRIMFGVFNPEEVTKLVLLGIDAFDSSYATFLTENGRALIIEENFDLEKPNYLEFDLKNSDKFRKDFKIIHESCSCYTCANGFTRAYINHLLTTKEMLAFVLLTMHNLQMIYAMFSKIRRALNS